MMNDMEVLDALRRVNEVCEPPVTMGMVLPNDFWDTIIDYVNAAPRLLEIFEAAIKRDAYLYALDEEYEHMPVTEDGLSER